MQDAAIIACLVACWTSFLLEKQQPGRWESQ